MSEYGQTRCCKALSADLHLCIYATPRLETSRKIHLRSRLKNSILTAATPSSATVSDFSNRGGLFLADEEPVMRRQSILAPRAG